MKCGKIPAESEAAKMMTKVEYDAYMATHTPAENGAYHNQVMMEYKPPFTLAAALHWTLYLLVIVGFAALVWWGFLYAIHYPGVYSGV
jgi:hypothetical protein